MFEPKHIHAHTDTSVNTYNEHKITCMQMCVYTLLDAISLTWTYMHQTQVFALTDGNHQQAYDGLSHYIINRNNTCLFSHELLHDCWVTLATTRSSFWAYWAKYKRTCIFLAGGPEQVTAIKTFFEKDASYKHFKDACFDFKSLLKVDMKDIFACECNIIDKLRRLWMYDNGCNAEISACNRDASMLAENIIKVDEFHHTKNEGGHKNCSPFCSSENCAPLENVNTSYIEQVNSVLANAKTSAPYFAQENFIEYLEAIVMFYNMYQREKNLKMKAAGGMPPMPMAVKQCDAVCISIKSKHAHVVLPHEQPVIVEGQAPIIGVSVEDRMMIPDCHAREALRKLISADGVDLQEAELYLRDRQYLNPCLIPYIQWGDPVAGKVHLDQDLRVLEPVLKHFASNACELQNVPALIIDAVQKIAEGKLITGQERNMVMMHSPGIKELLVYDQLMPSSKHASVQASSPQESSARCSPNLCRLLSTCVTKSKNIISAGKVMRTEPVDDGWTPFERKIRTATIGPNRGIRWAYPNFQADIDLRKSKKRQHRPTNSCPKYPTFSANLMPGLFVVVCVGCRKIELVQMMPSHESPLTAYKAMYQRDWS